MESNVLAALTLAEAELRTIEETCCLAAEPYERKPGACRVFDALTAVSGAIKAINGLVIEGPAEPESQTPILDAWFRQRAKEEYEHEGDIEIDEGAVVSYGDEGGAYVAAWVWVERSPIECHCGKQMFVTDGVAHHGVPDEIDAAADLDHTAEEMEPEDASKCRTCEGMGYKSAAVVCVVCKGRGHFDSPAEARAAQKETRGNNG